MLGFHAPAARATWTVFLVCSALAGVWLLRDVLFMLIIATFFAYFLTPLVDLATRIAPRRVSRNLSLALVYLIFLSLIVAATGWLGMNAAEQASGLAGRLPELVKNRVALETLPLPSWLEPYRMRAIEWLVAHFSEGFGAVMPVMASLGQKLLSGLGAVAIFLLMPIFSFFFLKDGRAMADAAVERLAPARHRELFAGILAGAHLMLSQYIRSLVLLSLVALGAYGIFFIAAGVPYPVLLAVLGGSLEFIPVLGPLLAGLIAVLVAAFSGYAHVAWLIVFLVLFRLFQDYVTQPWLLGSGIALHPAAVLFGVIAGEQLGGVAGMFLSVPTLALARVVFIHVRKAAERA